MDIYERKSRQLLEFLQAFAQLRRSRAAQYDPEDRLIWLGDCAGLEPEVHSPLLSESNEGAFASWLEVRKPSLSPPPPVPSEVTDFFHVYGLDTCEVPPYIEPRGPAAGKWLPVRQAERVAAARAKWEQYVRDQWRPWAETRKRLNRVQELYEDLDFMRRRIEEAQERYEAVLGVGLLVWRESKNITIKRHLLTARAEILFDARRGLFTVSPDATLESFRVELDMLGVQHQPRLEKTELDKRLRELGVLAWDREAIAEILGTLGNLIAPDCTVEADRLDPGGEDPQRPRIYYAPALVLRQRKLTAYEEMLGKLLNRTEDDSLRLTRPWIKLVCEGESDPDGKASQAEDSRPASEDGRLYFPLPTNREQRSIAERLRSHVAVLVKGPPGTGKSHTIANLICHLLARGERVLVTAHAAKALEVLLDLLPDEIGALCVTSLGSGRDELRRLDESVRQILARHDSWLGSSSAATELARLEQELQQLEREAEGLERELRNIREAETYSHTLQGGYAGTAAQIAQQVEQAAPRYAWFPGLPDPDSEYPLRAEETAFLAEFHGQLTPARLEELQSDLGPDLVPSPDQFRSVVGELEALEMQLRQANDEFAQSAAARLKTFEDRALEAMSELLDNLEDEASRAQASLGELADQVLRDCLAGNSARWRSLIEQARQAVDLMRKAAMRIQDTRVELREEPVLARWLFDARRRREHFRQGGRRGWWIFAPAVERETRYLEQACLVDGRPPRGVEELEKLVALLEFQQAAAAFRKIWPSPLDDPTGSATFLADRASRQLERLHPLVSLFDKPCAGWLKLISSVERVSLAEATQRERWRRMLRAETLRRRVQRQSDRLLQWRAPLVEIAALSRTHPCVREMEEAILIRDTARYHAAWEQRQRLRQAQLNWARYEDLLARIHALNPPLAAMLREHQGQPHWKDRILALPEAWAWAAAKSWLQRVVEPGRWEELAERRIILQRKIEKRLTELAELKAWAAFFERLDERTRQSLIGWKNAIKRIGKGTGVHAWRHRQAARSYMMECLPRIPAWIMPLYRVWEMTAPEPGVFDTVIVDEASQAGVEALLLFLLAKRIVVVGDDMQNSPEAVGILEQDIARVFSDHLRDFRYREEYRPDSSLYDHAERAFGGLISLREHFRCVPEIIRFSNELCYRDAPLIPLRQAPADRLPPLRRTFVPGATCHGDGANILNQAEAEAIVEAILRCLADPAYAEKTMGVIVLQGHRQAEWIEQELARRVAPQVRQQRRLRCGVPATFQGDQRDVIFLSLVVAPNHPFRALTEIEAQRRFNVAMSRARDQVWLFHSVEPHDLRRDDLRWRLLNFFLEPMPSQVLQDLALLERECAGRSRRPGEQPEPYESWFEVDVALELLRRGYRIRPQWEVAGYRIDLVIEGTENRLAVECDGDEWHGPERFEYDLQRQRQLERAGWRFVRIRASEFYADREAALKRVQRACEELDIRPAGSEAPVEAEAFEPDAGEHARAPAEVAVGNWDQELIEETAEGAAEVAMEQDEESTEDIEAGEVIKLPRRDLEDPLGWCVPDPRVASRAALFGALLRIIREEGPLNKRRLYRLYVQRCPAIERLSKTVRQALDAALRVLIKTGEITVSSFAGEDSPEFQEIRAVNAPQVRAQRTRSRDLLEIPPSELLEVLRELSPPTRLETMEDAEHLMRKLLNRYGMDRLTVTRRRYLEKVLQAYRRNRSEERLRLGAI